MTPEEINIAIAEHLGMTSAICTICRVCFGAGKWGVDHANECGLCAGTGAIEPFYIGPNYSGDLNACHEMVKVLHGKAYPNAVTDEDKAFRDELAKMMGCGWYHSASLIRATAAQRAEAFLRTVGKWKEAAP